MLSLLQTVKRKRAGDLARNPQLRHRAAKGIMNRNSFFRKQFVLQFVTVLILFGLPHIAPAQVGPAARLAPDISIFAMLLMPNMMNCILGDKNAERRERVQDLSMTLPGDR
jgi:hypothetical protein